MSETPLTLPPLAEDDTAQAEGGVDCAREVIDAYTAVLTNTRHEQRAFEQAVRIYQARNPAATTEATRRAVALIICNKP